MGISDRPNAKYRKACIKGSKLLTLENPRVDNQLNFWNLFFNFILINDK
jgi:hypothetical protein